MKNSLGDATTERASSNSDVRRSGEEFLKGKIFANGLRYFKYPNLRKQFFKRVEFIKINVFKCVSPTVYVSA